MQEHLKLLQTKSFRSGVVVLYLTQKERPSEHTPQHSGNDTNNGGTIQGLPQGLLVAAAGAACPIGIQKQPETLSDASDEDFLSRGE
jgi:hypothetical protein